MPLSEGRIAAIVAAAEKMAENEPEKQQEQFKVDFVAVMTVLNEKIEERVGAFKSEAAEVLASIYPKSPGGVLALSDKLGDACRVTAVAVTDAIDKEAMPPTVRTMMTDAVIDLLRCYRVACIEGESRALRRHGLRLA